MGQRVSSVFKRTARGLAAGAAVLLGGCVWSADYPLMPSSAAERTPPVTPGAYTNSYGSSLIVSGPSGAVSPVNLNEERYRVTFDYLYGDFYLAEAIRNDGSIAYVLVQPSGSRIVVRQMDCEEDGQYSIAMAAGARYESRNDGEGHCVFSNYDQLINATWSVISRIRSDPNYLPGTVYTR